MKTQLISFALILFFTSAFDSCNRGKNKNDSAVERVNNSTKKNVIIAKPRISISDMADKHFLSYKQNLEDTNVFVGLHKTFIGDFTGDNKEDVLITYNLGLQNGGNANMG